MPWQTSWVDPELFLEYKGVKVYHTYKDDDFEERLMYWYAIYPTGCFHDDYIEFDVRNLPAPAGINLSTMEKLSNYAELHRKIIEHAIDQGYITQKGVDKRFL